MEEKLYEIKQVSEREIWVGANRLYLSEENILYETLVGEQDESVVRKIYDTTDRLMASIEGQLKIIVDLNLSGKASSQARKLGQEMLRNKRYKVAIFGLHPVAKVLASFFLGNTSGNNAHFFNSKEVTV